MTEAISREVQDNTEFLEQKRRGERKKNANG